MPSIGPTSDVVLSKLTVTRVTIITNPSIEKKTTNAFLPNNLNTSSRLCSLSSTTPKTAINTAPAATNPVPTIAPFPNTSPSINLAKRALYMSETAPRGARMTMGSASSWNIVEKMFEVM